LKAWGTTGLKAWGTIGLKAWGTAGLKAWRLEGLGNDRLEGLEAWRLEGLGNDARSITTLALAVALLAAGGCAWAEQPGGAVMPVFPMQERGETQPGLGTVGPAGRLGRVNLHHRDGPWVSVTP
jgi:hypothetical protein